MFKKVALLFASLLLGAQLWASSATFSRIKNWTDLEVLYSADLNAEFNNILNNLGPAGIGGYSASTTEMRSTADPYPGSVESLATSLQGELERVRYQILQIKNSIQASSVTYWYQDLPTAGVFTIAGSSVGINDTTPDYILDVAGTLGVDGLATFNGQVSASTITTTLPALSIATHTAITGNLTVSGTFAPVTLTPSGTTTFPGMSHVIARGNSAGNLTLTSPTSVTVVNWITSESVDTLSEWNGSTFTATNTGNYCWSVSIRLNPNSATSGGALMRLSAYVGGVAYFERIFSFPTLASVSADFPLDNTSCASLTAGDKLDFRYDYLQSGSISGIADRSSTTSTVVIYRQP